MIILLLSPLICVIILAFKSIFKKTTDESFVSSFSQISFILYFLGAVATIGAKPYQYLYLDLPGIVYLCSTAVIANIIVFYSRRYLHRDPGYRRFFMILSIFITGLTLIICAGTFDLIFAGWEIVGLSSFLLIGFYWHRSQAALNANRAYFIYRICDLGLLASAFIAHLIWHDHHIFFELSQGIWHTHWKEVNLAEQWALSLMILLPVIGKSAQFPLCYWLPRAMEGPTPSSAIFYGALSIHAGVFLLIRTFAIWFSTPGFVWVIGSIGFLTVIFATLCGRVQSNIKGQIGYASIAQVGIMLIELACGFPTLALIHMTGNAFLRCFQLLVSPSIVTQQLQIHNVLRNQIVPRRLSTPLRSTLYLLAINEGYLPNLIKMIFVKPVYRLAQQANYRWTVAPALLGSIALLGPLSYLILGLSLFCSLTALGETKSPSRVLHMVFLSNIFVATAIWFENRSAALTVLFYVLGLGVSWLLAADALRHISKSYHFETLTRFSGLFPKVPLASSALLVGILGLIGFPISSTFLGEGDLIEQALSSGWVFLVVFNSVFILNGITLIRLYSHLFWGKREHEATDASHDFSSLQAFVRIMLFIIANGVSISLIGQL